jgi:hypothetical protein
MLAFVAAGLEPVDPCGLITMDGHRTFDSGFQLQRAWSNRSAALGHDPCVPARADRPYVALVPRQPTVRLVKEGESSTITLDAFADRVVSNWAVSTFDLSGHQLHDQFVDATLDKTSVRSGDVVTLTLTARKASAAKLNVVAVVSTLGVVSHMWPIAIVRH